MIEIRFHGRGGQGAVIASEILARAAVMDGRYATASPFFGVERRGAPVTAYCRIDDRPIRIHAGIYEPDYVIVLDQSLIRLVDVTQGLKQNGQILVNSTAVPEGLTMTGGQKVSLVDATGIALRHRLGSPTAPIVNTAIVGAFARLCPIMKLGLVLDSVAVLAPLKKKENVAAAEEAHGGVVA